MSRSRLLGASALGLAAFVTYFSMYAFRKPFAAGTFEGKVFGDIDLKIVLVIAQVAGYTLSKYLGIVVISGMRPHQRATYLIGLVLVAEVALVLFGLVPPPFDIACLFLNGLPLGMVWGIVFSFVEGRRATEMLGAMLCSSFIVASGAVKTVGSWLMVRFGVSEYWMPAATGAIFLPVFVLGVWALTRFPPPSSEDLAARAPRPPMSRKERRDFVRSFPLGIVLLVGIYSVLNTYRDLRDNFAAELWQALDYGDAPEIFTLSELPIALVVVALASVLVLVRDNGRALWWSIATLPVGALLIGGATVAFQSGNLNGAAFMILVGLGQYIPYIAFHVGIYERLLAVLQRPSNVGFLMYLSDSAGYTGSVAALLYRNFGEPDVSWLKFFVGSSYIVAAACAASGLVILLYFRRSMRRGVGESTT